MVTSLLSFELV